MQVTEKKKTLKAVVLSAIVIAVAAVFLFPPALVNEAPFWDDKAYINNALIASGRLNPADARGPYAEERPPLFWWFLTGLYALNLPVEAARIVSPLLTTVGVVAMFLLVAKVFDSLLAGFVAALTTIVLNYFVLTTSFILTDALGSVIAFVALLSFSLGLRYGPFLWVAGGLTAVSILARDQNLLLLPVFLLSFAWMARTSKLVKAVYLGLLALVAFSAVFMGQENFLQSLSDALTPVITDRTFIPLLSVFTVFSVIAVYKVAEQKNLLSRKPSIEERAFDMFLAVAIMLFILLPFFIDNIRLGQEYQIEGRGIFSRPVAHSLMVKNDIARSGLGTVDRIVFWLGSIPSLFTAPLLVTAFAGMLMALKNRVQLAKPLILYFVLTIGYILPFTHIEYRFLAPAVPAAAAFTGYAVAQTARKSKVLGVALASVVLVYAFTETSFYGLVPTFQQPVVLTGWQVLLGQLRYAETWLSDYVVYLGEVLRPPNLLLPLAYVAAAWSTIVFLLAAIYIGFRNPL